MPYRQTGPSKGNRRPTVAVPGSSGSGRPTAQKGGGGNKAAGSVEPTAANTPTVSVRPDGTVVAEHFSGTKAGRAAAEAAVEAQRAREAHVKKVVALVNSKPERKPVVAKGTNRDSSSKPKTYAGKKTAGEPTLAALEKAQTEGALKTNKAGYLTTPEVRQASQKLTKAKAQVRKTTGLTGPLTASQKKFAKLVSKETGGILKPRTVATQALQEESGAAAKKRDAEGNYNALNIGYFDSGPGSLTKGSEWSSPKSAAKATAEFFKGDRYGPSSQIASILPEAKGKSVKQQLAIIGNSGWATSDYGPALEATSKLVGERRNPKAEAALKEAQAEARALGLHPGHVGPPPRQVVTKYKAARSAMSELDKLNNEGKEPYVWGGNHGRPGSYDCSGAVSYVLEKLKVLPKGHALVSGDMGSVLAPGPGALTVFYNAEHTFIYDSVKKEFWGTSQSNVEGGPGFFPKSVGNSEVQGGNSAGAYMVGHIPGLGKKQALQLGGSGPIPSGGIPGVTLSSGGTTATIEPGAGAKVGRPGFSKKPIIATPAPFSAEAALAQGELKAGKQASGPSTAVLNRLEAKYGAAA